MDGTQQYIVEGEELQLHSLASEGSAVGIGVQLSYLSNEVSEVDLHALAAKADQLKVKLAPWFRTNGFGEPSVWLMSTTDY
ncbi:MAG: hypothetical protein ABMB14_39075 [Myxococcota bacterium]